MNPQYPLYIVSKGRSDSRLTSKALEKMNTPYNIVVEEQEYDDYAKVIDKKKIIVLDKKYQDEYEVCDDLGRTKSVGPGAARNFVWEHSMSNGFKWHWVMDDNIQKFYRFNRNTIIPVGDGTIFRCMEDFCNRYTNVMMAGPNYEMFVARRGTQPPFVLNTRIYSCNLIRNSTRHHWRGRYNEDTDLSLMILKDGDCTIQFNAFLQKKVCTQTVSGGNSKEFYDHEGTMPKSQMLADMHPDVAEFVIRKCIRNWTQKAIGTPLQKNSKNSKILRTQSGT